VIEGTLFIPFCLIWILIGEFYAGRAWKWFHKRTMLGELINDL
jgi:hypothetical protein